MRSLAPRIATATASLGIVAVLSACAAPPAAPQLGNLRLGVPTNDVDLSFNPLEMILQAAFSGQAVYESLVVWNEETGDFDPRLAAAYELADDRRTLTVTLRDDVDFTDGGHLDADAAKAGWDLLLASGPQKAAFDTYGTSVAVTREYELVFRTTEKAIDDSFLLDVAQTPIVSPDALADPAALTDAPVGTGPYLFEERSPGVSATFSANPGYWDRDAIEFETVTLLVYDDPIAGLNALKSGQIDATAIDASLAGEAKSSGLAVHEGSGRFTTLAILDNDGELVPALGDVRVRQAINLAFDRQAILDSIDLGYGRISSQGGSELFPWYVEGGDDRYGYDPDQARELLAEAGYADGFDITIPTTPLYGQGPYEAVVQQSLADIGIRVTYEPIPEFGVWYEAAMSGRYPVLLFKDFYVNFTSYMRVHYYIPMVDATADRLLTIAEQGSIEEADAALAELGEYVLDQAWLAPLSAPATLWASVPELDMVVGDVLTMTKLRDFRLAG